MAVNVYLKFTLQVFDTISDAKSINFVVVYGTCVSNKISMWAVLNPEHLLGVLLLLGFAHLLY